MTLLGLGLGLLEAWQKIVNGISPAVPTIVLAALLLISGMQFTFFAMWFDMEHNRTLK